MVKKDIVKEWLAKGKKDMEEAVFLLENNSDFYIVGRYPCVMR